MLQNCGVLDGEGDSNIQFIQDSNSHVIQEKNFGEVLAGSCFYLVYIYTERQKKRYKI